MCDGLFKHNLNNSQTIPKTHTSLVTRDLCRAHTQQPVKKECLQEGSRFFLAFSDDTISKRVSLSFIHVIQLVPSPNRRYANIFKNVRTF